MPISGFINWGDIKGGGTDDKHEDWSEITGFSHGMSQPAQTTRSSEGGGYESEVIHDPFTVTVPQDRVPPWLYIARYSSQRFEVSIVFRELEKASTGKPQHTLKLPNAMVTDVRTSGGKLMVTINAPEYCINGLKNVPIPYHLNFLRG